MFAVVAVAVGGWLVAVGWLAGGGVLAALPPMPPLAAFDFEGPGLRSLTPAPALGAVVMPFANRTEGRFGNGFFVGPRQALDVGLEGTLRSSDDVTICAWLRSWSAPVDSHLLFGVNRLQLFRENGGLSLVVDGAATPVFATSICADLTKWCHVCMYEREEQPRKRAQITRAQRARRRQLLRERCRGAYHDTKPV